MTMTLRRRCLESGGKQRYANRLAATSALHAAAHQWRRDPARATQPPTRVYRCPECDGWHLTHLTRADG